MLKYESPHRRGPFAKTENGRIRRDTRRAADKAKRAFSFMGLA